VIDSPRTTHSHPKGKIELNELMGLNKDPLHKKNKQLKEKDKEDFFDSDEDKSYKKSSSEDDSSQSEEEKIQESSQNIVNFLIKLPKNLEKYVNYYKELSSKKTIQISTENSMNLFSKTIKEKSDEINIINPLNLLKKNYNSTEKATETSIKTLQIDENCRKELKAIVLTAEKISRNKLLNIYKVKAVISSKNYGDNKDILKVIKVLSIQKKVEKFNNSSANLPLSMISEEYNKSPSLKKPLNSLDENDKVFNFSPTLTNKIFQTRTNTNELSATNLEEIPFKTNEQSPLNLIKIESQNLNFDGFPDNTIENTEKIGQNQPKYFIKSFQKNKGSNNENLFLKEDTVKAHKSLKIITKIKWFIRLLFLGIFSLSLITYFLGPFSEFQTLKNKSNKIYLTKSNELKILQGYNVLMNFLFINSGYFSGILSSNSSLADYRRFQKEDFSMIYRFLIDLNQDPLMKNVLFDSSVFPSLNIEYSTEFINTKDLYEIQNKDLLFLYIEKLNNIYNSTDFIVDITDPDIVFFRRYILPTLINLLKNIQIKLFNSINTTKIYINDFMLYILLIEVSLLLLTFVVLLRYILQVTNSFQTIIEIFTYIDNVDVRAIKRRFLDMLKSIAKTTKTLQEDDNLTEKTDKFSRGTLTDIGKKTEIQDKSEQQFKKLKKFKVGNFLWNMKKRVLFYYFFFILVSSCLSIGFYFLVKQTTGQIETLLLNGETIIGLIDGDSILLVALKENVYNSTNYQENIYEKIAQELPELLRLQSNLYIKEIDFAEFDQVSYAYFYTNPCYAYGKLNSEEIQECLNISLGKLSFGMVSFNNYFFSKIFDFLTIKTEGKFGNLTENEVFEFDRAIYYSNQFILDILRVWSLDMSNVLDNSYKNLTIYLSFMMFTLIGAFIIAENLVVGKLKSSYKYYRGIYNNFMPTELVSKERLIKAKLVLANVLNK